MTHLRIMKNIPMLFKLIEKTDREKLTTLFTRNNVITPSQFEFQLNKSTNVVIIRFLEKLYLLLNKGRMAAAVF